MEQLIPSDLLNYFLVFQIHFSKPNFIYFQAYLCGLLLTNGRKTMSQIAQCCFWVERSLSSWERFLSENLWDVNAVCQTLVNLLLEQLDSVTSQKVLIGSGPRFQEGYFALIPTSHF